MKIIYKILPLFILLFACNAERSEDDSTTEKLDPNVSPVTVPFQIFESNSIVEECFYKNNYMKMIAYHPQISKYAWYKCSDDPTLSTETYLSSDSVYTTSLNGKYRLDIEKTYPTIGEIDTSIYIELNYCPTWVDVPNSFTPSNAGQFNTWMPFFEGVNQFYLRISNDDGDILFETSDFNASFNGKYQGTDLPSGTYNYYLSGTYKSRILFEKKGSFALVR